MSKRRDYDHLIKLLLIGDSGVGKSCLLLRFSEDSFTNSFITTIGIDFKIKKIQIDGTWIKLQIWDTAGQERFRTITSAYYRGAMGILLVYDVGDANSFKNIRNWMKNIEQHASVNVVKGLVGNKCDISEGERAVSKSQAQELADEYGIPFYETSAKTGENVENVFRDLAEIVYGRLKKDQQQPSGAGGRVALRDVSYASTKKSSCC
ncbi:hypothetical protein M9434_004716 [Picochlorum sp. BPE23]|nr:hypothetical protein M9435_002800 [Picochlorum sp. BPE23]KAI8111143.1 hypothetical protein M9434_004716 [Picochlorum sp. BPE23]|mmetsp:Transcript_9674/g.19189  ORF Transcript_9674/g.19189 Transcript_9674/m.19189 type:complete len:207 (-) Transcript_9674:159-779(-)|eukprot:CAMPEP_0118806580 /NCGR_PEP_ID=MMETSP1161-20130426/32173_1 /TAXON_ID=249345 /ORGANISM="Picochlorum oklahomensis, Strain CCMP2329" /LENGTH=206 /DNA_ID=CAMNT_0006735777 /DNA_START=35 /DNA_END=655 /DNA_ORIENTATION=+